MPLHGLRAWLNVDHGQGYEHVLRLTSTGNTHYTDTRTYEDNKEENGTLAMVNCIEAQIEYNTNVCTWCNNQASNRQNGCKTGRQ